MGMSKTLLVCRGGLLWKVQRVFSRPSSAGPCRCDRPGGYLVGGGPGRLAVGVGPVGVAGWVGVHRIGFRVRNGV